MKTSKMVEIIQRKLETTSYTQTKLLGWFKSIGNIQEIPRGMLKHTITTLEKMEPGEVVASFSALPNNVPRFTEQTTNLLTLGAKVQIPLQVLHQWQGNSQIDVDLQQIINEQMKSMITQIDQFLAYGDSFKTPRTGDRLSAQDFALGIFNGGTPFLAGDGEDDIMDSKGDYQSTITNAIKALKNAGFEGDGYWIFSDTDTQAQAELGVHQLNTYTFTNEYNAILARKYIKAWLDSPNFTNPSGEHRIVVTNPFRNNGPDQKEKDFAYRLLQGYNLDVFPLYGGGLGPSVAYEFVVAWSGALEIINSEAIQSSGALTLT